MVQLLTTARITRVIKIILEKKARDITENQEKLKEVSFIPHPRALSAGN